MVEKVLDEALSLLLRAEGGIHAEPSRRIVEAVAENLGEEFAQAIILPKILGIMGLKVEGFVGEDHPFYDDDGDFGLLVKVLGVRNVEGESDIGGDIFESVTGYKSDDRRYDDVEVVLEFERGESLGVSLVDSKEKRECVVKDISDGGIACSAGLKVDDIIFSVAGEVVEGVEELQAAMAGAMEEGGGGVTLGVRRYDVAVGLRDSILPVLVQGVGAGLPKPAMVNLLKVLIVGVNEGSASVTFDVVVDTLSRLASSGSDDCKESLLKCLVELVEEGEEGGGGENDDNVKLTVCNLLSISVNYFEVRC